MGGVAGKASCQQCPARWRKESRNRPLYGTPIPQFPPLIFHSGKITMHIPAACPEPRCPYIPCPLPFFCSISALLPVSHPHPVCNFTQIIIAGELYRSRCIPHHPMPCMLPAFYFPHGVRHRQPNNIGSSHAAHKFFIPHRLLSPQPAFHLLQIHTAGHLSSAIRSASCHPCNTANGRKHFLSIPGP